MNIAGKMNATVEGRGLPGDILLEPNLAPGHFDLLVQRRPQVLLAGEGRSQLGAQQLEVRQRRRISRGDRFRGRARFLLLAARELRPETRPEAPFHLAGIWSHGHPRPRT